MLRLILSLSEHFREATALEACSEEKRICSPDSKRIEERAAPSFTPAKCSAEE
jgi:hypothetical protein